MVTVRPGIALGVLTADCTPVLLADRAAGVIGAYAQRLEQDEERSAESLAEGGTGAPADAA